MVSKQDPEIHIKKPNKKTVITIVKKKNTKQKPKRFHDIFARLRKPKNTKKLPKHQRINRKVYHLQEASNDRDKELQHANTYRKLGWKSKVRSKKDLHGTYVGDQKKVNKI